MDSIQCRLAGFVSSILILYCDTGPRLPAGLVIALGRRVPRGIALRVYEDPLEVYEDPLEVEQRRS